MSESVESTIGRGLKIPGASAPVGIQEDDRVFDLREISKHRLFYPSVMMVITLCLAFFSLWKVSYEEWVAPESLYSHGPLIPLLAAYIVWIRWPKMKDTPVEGPQWWVLAVFVPVFYVAYIAARTEMKETQSVLFLVSLVASIWFVAGKRWVWALAPIIAFLVFCLPVWTSVIDKYTLSMQHASADMAVRILELLGLHPLRTDPTTVYLDNFTLNVAAACSGAKLTLALMAFTAFFMLTRQARLWANLVLVVILIPFCLFVNGIRIAMVGVVGNAFGDAAGRQFHDWGGYIALVICFVLLSSITKALGYK